MKSLKSLLSLFLLFFSPLAEASTDLVLRNRVDADFLERDLSKTKSWYYSLWNQAKALDLSSEEFLSSASFQIAVIKSLASLALEKPLIDLDQLPEFMNPNTEKLKNIRNEIDRVVKIAGVLAFLKTILKAYQIELSKTLLDQFYFLSKNSSMDEFYLSVAAFIKKLLFDRGQKNIDVMKMVENIKKHTTIPAIQTKLRSDLFSHLNKNLRDGSFDIKKDDLFGYFYLKHIQSLSASMAFWVKMYSLWYEKTLRPLVLLSRFDRLVFPLLSEKEISEEFKEHMPNFYNEKFLNLKKKLKSLCLWDSSYFLFTLFMSQYLPDKTKEMALSFYIRRFFDGFSKDVLFESDSESISKFYRELLATLFLDETFRKEFEFKDHDFFQIKQKISQNFSGFKSYIDVRMKMYISQVRGLVGDQRNQSILADFFVVSSEASMSIFDEIKNYTHLLLDKAERRSEKVVGLCKPFPGKIATGFKYFTRIR